MKRLILVFVLLLGGCSSIPQSSSYFGISPTSVGVSYSDDGYNLLMKWQ